ncbi:PepSY domain-containing protein [Marinobacterium aestuariivivens]|uniref:PepSY domain-containing protein n=1 Tax=Marinobacterium aestuariivivens TaxID=1698799 RepID=A0ABW1ZYY1_9GAMM
MLRMSHWHPVPSLLAVVGLGFCLLLSPLARAEAATTPGALLLSRHADGPALLSGVQPVTAMVTPPGQSRRLSVAQQEVSLQQAVELVRSRYKGQVVKATAIESQGRTAYRIRLVHEGRVREVLVDAQSGQIINP